MVGDQGKVVPILRKMFGFVGQSYFKDFNCNAITLVSVLMPLSNTLLWSLKACLKKLRIKNSLLLAFFHRYSGYFIFPCDVNCLITFSAPEATSSITSTQFSCNTNLISWIQHFVCVWLCGISIFIRFNSIMYIMDNCSGC